MYPLGASAFLARSYSKFKSGVANNNSSHVPRHSKLSPAHSDACNDPYWNERFIHTALSKVTTHRSKRSSRSTAARSLSWVKPKGSNPFLPPPLRRGGGKRWGL